MCKKLIQAREKKRLSQSDVARLVGVYPSNISRIESGKQKASPTTAKKLVQVLGRRNLKEVDLIF